MAIGMGSAGVVIKMEGIDSRREAAPNAVCVFFKLVGGGCCERQHKQLHRSISVTLGPTVGNDDASKNASGRITATAMATESAESSLKDCDRLGLGVIGCTVPFRDAYKGTVQKVLKANATAANGEDYQH